MHTFRTVVESGEFETIDRIFADDVVLHSPIAHRPYRGRQMVAAIIGAVAQVLEDFRFEKEIGNQEAGALLFRASVGDLEIQGCDFLHTRDDGMIDEITVMLRPLKAVTLFAERMEEEFGKAMARNDVAASEGF
ncbi:MAG TPA: nuclear transport factor 2 family protein [Mycobacterium sp.]|nr:nuclear transport factor 2 family protein [Mycobacterium sp.]